MSTCELPTIAMPFSFPDDLQTRKGLYPTPIQWSAPLDGSLMFMGDPLFERLSNTIHRHFWPDQHRFELTRSPI